MGSSPTADEGVVRGPTTSGLVYEQRGRGTPLIFLHGWCLNRRMWMYAEELFAEQACTITPDLAGFGRSDGLAGPYTFERHAQDIADLIRELDLDNVVVCGFAFGAAVTMELAARHPQGLDAIVLVAVPSSEDAPYDRMPKAMRRDWPDFARRSADALFHNDQSAETIGWLTDMFAAAPLPVATETVRLLAHLNPVELAGQVDVPQLFIHGAEDLVAPVSVGRACIDAAPAATLEVISGCGHLIPLDAKDAFHGVLATYVNGLKRNG